tara:strand:- start:6071 stop:7561 length:1491 start_codon:yes stop_codon:yes gene_type:complete
MSTNLYKEAIAEAQQLKLLAEQNAKNKIIEALTPRIQAMVESQLLSEQEEIQLVDVEGPIADVVSDELIDDEEGEVESSIHIDNADGVVNLTVSETFQKNLGELKAQYTNSTSSDRNKLAERIARLRGKVRRMDALLNGLNANALSEQQKSVIKKSYQKLLAEAVTLRSEAIVNSSNKSQGNRLAIFETLKEMNIMTNKRSRAIFNQLFEAGLGELDEMELVLSDEDLEALGVEDAEEADVDALDLELVADVGEDEEVEGEEEEAEGEEEEAEGEEEEEVALDLGEVFEIDPRMLKMELRKLRRMREATEGSVEATDMADQFGGGEVEDESFIDVDEDDLLNALADELGDPGVPTPTVESRRRRARASRRRRMAERRSGRRATNSTTRENRALKQQLSEMNLFNAKLLYVNKLMQNRNVSSKQQRAIVEALDNAKTIREAKLVYESITRSLNKKSLSEGKRRVLGSSSKPTRRGSAAVNESGQTDRWARLAGIKNK